MAFKLRFECEYCGSIITATKEEAEQTICPCEYQEDQELQKEMSAFERKERYKRQYKENGYSWLDKAPWMWKGELN